MNVCNEQYEACCDFSGFEPDAVIDAVLFTLGFLGSPFTNAQPILNVHFCFIAKKNTYGTITRICMLLSVISGRQRSEEEA